MHGGMHGPTCPNPNPFFFFFWLQGMWDLSSQTRDQTCVLCIGRWILNHWTTRQVPQTNFLANLIPVPVWASACS